MEKLSFGKALEALKNGKKITRESNKGMFLFKTTGRVIPLEEFGKFKNGNSEAIELAIELGIHKGNEVVINDHINMVACDGSIVVGWQPSESAIMAEDWIILE
jgi:hypothetical protein